MSTRGTAKDLTPYEMLRGQRPDLSRLRVFGCKAYLHVSSKHQDGKSGHSAEEGILVGYGKGNSYRVLLEKSKKIVVSQDVTVVQNVHDEAVKRRRATCYKPSVRDSTCGAGEGPL